MPTTMINPAALPTIDIYHQVAVATGSKLVFVAGQVAWDAELDLAVQVEQAYVNVNAAVVAAGGSFDDVARLTFYAVDWTPDKMPALLDGIERGKKSVGTTATPPLTMIGVVTLDIPEHLVEIEATAVLN